MNTVRDHLILLVFALLLFIPFLGSVHLFDWDEINFAESAREMLLTGEWWRVTINFEPFWEKPPLFFWLQALSMRLFGVTEFAARLPNALCGIATLKVLYEIGRQWHGKRFAWLWVFLYAGSFLPHLYFKSAIIDPWFNLFIFLAVYTIFYISEHAKKNQIKLGFIGGLLIGLAILTKGPVGLLILGLTFMVWLVHTHFKSVPSLKVIGVFGATALVVSSVWFGFETIQNGPWFITEFVEYQINLFLNPVAGHQQPFFYHFVVVLLGCFPLSALALPAFSNRFNGDSFKLSMWMKYLFWVVLILFSLVTTKIVHYSSMAYLPLSYLATLAVIQSLEKNRIKNWVRLWILAQGAVIAFALILTPILLSNMNLLTDRITDPFVLGNLASAVEPVGWEWIIGTMYFGVCLSSYFLLKTDPYRGLLILSIGTALTIFSTMISIVPLIESVSQRSAITFFENHADEESYKATYGYKSYAPYFYGKVTPETALKLPISKNSKLDKPAYVSVMIKRNSRFLEEFPSAEKLSEKGGYVFYRLPPTLP